MFRKLFVATSYPTLSLALLVTLMPVFQQQNAYSSTNNISQKKRRRLARQSGNYKK